jgi:hypothetical protein
LSSPNGNGKYRPEVKGLPSCLFNLDLLDDTWVILVEGEFKSMVIWQNALPVIGSPGTMFKDEWIQHLAGIELVYVTYDPGAEKNALKTAKKLIDNSIDSRIVRCPTKPDDFFVVDGGSLTGFVKLLDDAQTYEQALRGDTQRWTKRYGAAFSRLRQ